MRVIILTSGSYGAAGHHLPILAESDACEVVMVVRSFGLVRNRRKYFSRKLKKLARIGPWGALNGIRMRAWYGEDVRRFRPSPPVESTCREHGIPFYTTPAVNCAETRSLFKSARADLGISLGNGYIARSVFAIPKHGMINIHHELLPGFQNAQSVIWQLYNGSSETGYTIHRIDDRIDTGDILVREVIPIHFMDSLAETVAMTSALLWDASARGLVQCLRHFDRTLAEAQPQGPGRSYTTPTLRQFLQIRRNFAALKKRAAGD